jgi:hypothetical protein
MEPYRRREVERYCTVGWRWKDTVQLEEGGKMLYSRREVKRTVH